MLTTGHEQYGSQRPGRLPRCREHGLAYVNKDDLQAAAADPLLGTTVADRFTVLARLGVGSMGSIYRARQEAVGRDVALKIVRRAYDPEARARFEREARATSALVSPYTVTVFDFGEAQDESWFLAMELLDGETLGQRLRRETRLDVEEAVTIARQALSSLAEAHSKGIVHRDLKPDNLFLTKLPRGSTGQEGEVCKVLDFGIAKVLGDEAKVDQLQTQAGTVFGTPRYMSPEQAQGRPLDVRTDLYSLGVLLFQMLMGRAPFVDDDAVVVMARHIENEPPPFAEVAPEADIPHEVEAVVRRALAKSLEDRFQTAEEFSTELEVALAQSGVAGTGAHRISWVAPPSSQARPRGAGRSRRRTVLLALAGAASIGLLAVGLLVAGSVGRDDGTRGYGSRPRAVTPPGPQTESGQSALSPAASGSAAAAEVFSSTGPQSGPDAGVDSAPTEAGPRRRTGAGAAAARRGPAPKRPAPDVRMRPEDRYGRFE